MQISALNPHILKQLFPRPQHLGNQQPGIPFGAIIQSVLSRPFSAITISIAGSLFMENARTGDRKQKADRGSDQSIYAQYHPLKRNSLSDEIQHAKHGSDNDRSSPSPAAARAGNHCADCKRCCCERLSVFHRDQSAPHQFRPKQRQSRIYENPGQYLRQDTAELQASDRLFQTENPLAKSE